MNIETTRRTFIQTGAAAASLSLFDLHSLFAAEGVPQSVAELWADFDPRKDPLEVEVIREWKEDGGVFRHVRYFICTFKGKPARIAAVYGFPEGAKEKLPAVMHIHGGGQRGSVSEVKLDEADQGLSDAALDATDVLIFWSHRRAKEQIDARAEAVVKRVKEGKLGFIGLHSAHWAKPFVRLMQERAKADALKQVPEAERATAKWEFVNDAPYYKLIGRASRITPYVEKVEGAVWRLTLPQCVFPAYRNDGMPSHVTTLLPQHPIAAGLPAQWDIPRTEMYGEPFHVPPPDEVVFEEKWDKGEHFRRGCVWTVGQGRVFYFRPGHETYPIFQQAETLRVIENAVQWMGSAITR